MFPNMDPKALKGMLDKLGIKSKSIPSDKVVIYCGDKDIIIEEPEVTLIEGQGMKTFQIGGKISELDKTAVEISEDDVNFVKEQTGIADDVLIIKTLQETRGDMAEAIVRLKDGK